LYQAHEDQIHKNQQDFAQLRPNFAWLPENTVKHTFKCTTQYARIVFIVDYNVLGSMALSKIIPTFDWSSYCLDNIVGESGVLGVAKNPFNAFDKKTSSFVNNKNTLLSVLDNPKGACFLLVPVKGKQVCVLHLVFVIDPGSRNPIVVRISGPKKYSPFKATPVSQIIRHLKNITSKTGYTPSPSAFDGVTSVKEFRALKGSKLARLSQDSPVGIYLLHPSYFFIHNSIGRSAGPAKLAVEIIKICNKKTDKETDNWTKRKPEAWRVYSYKSHMNSLLPLGSG
jgi:hypothetical protein